MTSDKPREFWLIDGKAYRDENCAKYNNFQKMFITVYPVHVIEISAMEAKDQLLREALETLEFYGKKGHFDWCGLDDYEPENPSGEPLNWESGGGEGSEFNLENGGFARAMASRIKEGLG